MVVGTLWPGEAEEEAGEGAQRNGGWGEAAAAGDLAGRIWVGEAGEDGMKEEGEGGRREAGGEVVIGERAAGEEGEVGGRNGGEAGEARRWEEVGI